VRSYSGEIVAAFIDKKEILFFVSNKADWIQREHAVGRFYEPQELAIISEFFPEGGVFVDIGANIGNHSIYVGRYLSPREIIVFEPNPPAIALLQINIILNGLQQVTDMRHLGLGVSDAPGNAQIWTAAGNLGGTRLVTDGQAGGLPLVRGDDVLAGRRVDFIKIDIEGMELQALAGLAATIATCRPVMFIEVDNVNAATFEAWVQSNGYAIARRFRRYASNENYLIRPA
jgi:FkbM family methyltransferase